MNLTELTEVYNRTEDIYVAAAAEIARITKQIKELCPVQPGEFLSVNGEKFLVKNVGRIFGLDESWYAECAYLGKTGKEDMRRRWRTIRFENIGGNGVEKIQG